MRLISVRAILDIKPEHLKPEDEILKEFSEDEIADRYAILSHCWGKANEEVKLKDIQDLPKLKKKARRCIQQRPGYQKIIETCKQARRDGFKWVWVDTCCINKESSAELSEVINSMYRWYESAGKCYAYLHDVDEVALPKSPDYKRFMYTSGWPRWFSRGWTLQELIAPKDVHFFNAEWQPLDNGTKTCLASTLWKITGIPVSILRHGLDSDRPSTAQIMSWAAGRTTTRVEDRAYSLMGLFGIYMPMLYGEGRNAFQRLQLEIIRTTNDHSIFAWRGDSFTSSVLAKDPSSFKDCSDVVRMEPEEYRRIIEENTPEEEITKERLRTCSVTNGGIQIWLPIGQNYILNTSEAVLACRDDSGPICIRLVHAGSQYHRTRRHSDGTGRLHFQQLFLAYKQMAMQSMHLKLNDSTASRQGFVREYIYPFEDTSTETISIPANGHAAVSYFNQSTNTRFAVVLGSIVGQPWVHLTVPRPGSSSEIEDYAESVYDDMWDAGPQQVEAITRSGKVGKNYCHIKHRHLPRSISDVRLTLQSLPQRNTHSITLDIIQCPGVCVPDDRWQSFDTGHVFEGCVLGNERVVLDKKISGTLLVDGIPTVFARTLTDEVKLGDYGHWNEDNKCFKWEGNIFKQSTTAFRPDLRLIEHEIRHSLNFCNEDDCVQIYSDDELVLRQPRGLSLSNDERISDLLNALSTCLKGKCLITTVIQCSALHIRKYGARHPWPDYDHPDDSEWESVPLSVPLFIPTQPLRWCRQGNCGETRAYFQEIRNQFSILSNALDPTSTDVKAAVNFLSNLFVGQYLQDYIGEIAFFRRVSSIQSARTTIRQSVESGKGCQAIQLQYPGASSDEWLGQVGVTCLRSRIELLTRKLAQRLPIKIDASIDDALRRQFSRDTYESAWRVASKAFGAEVLQIIVTIYQRPWLLQQKSSDEDCDSLVSDHQEQCDGHDENEEASYVDYNSIKLLIQEVETLQTQLNACDDEDERRALEEDITGKILLACWRGVQGELKQVLTKVVDHVVHDKDINRSVQHARAAFLNDMASTIRIAETQTYFDHRDYIWRITTDAEESISKHALLLAARQHAKDMASTNEPPENVTMQLS